MTKSKVCVCVCVRACACVYHFVLLAHQKAGDRSSAGRGLRRPRCFYFATCQTSAGFRTGETHRGKVSQHMFTSTVPTTECVIVSPCQWRLMCKSWRSLYLGPHTHRAHSVFPYLKKTVFLNSYTWHNLNVWLYVIESATTCLAWFAFVFACWY